MGYYVIIFQADRPIHSHSKLTVKSTKFNAHDIMRYYGYYEILRDIMSILWIAMLLIASTIIIVMIEVFASTATTVSATRTIRFV